MMPFGTAVVGVIASPEGAVRLEVAEGFGAELKDGIARLAKPEFFGAFDGLIGRLDGRLDGAAG